MSNSTSSSTTPTSSSSSTSSSVSTSSSSLVTTPSTTPSTTTPSTTSATPTSTSVSVVDVTSTLTVTPSNTGGTGGPTVTTLTSTLPATTQTPTASSASTRSSSATSTPSALSASGSGKSGGLGSGGTIAIAVVIPIVVVAAGVLLAVWFWRKRKARKNAEELRKNEMAEYGFNPNSDPTLPGVIGAGYTDTASETPGESGYRGWGTTSTNTHKPSTTLGSQSRNAALAGTGMAYSDTTSQPGGYGFPQSSSHPTSQPPDHQINGHHGNGEDIGVFGPAAAGVGAVTAAGVAGAAVAGNRHSAAGPQRGSSTASSAYTGGRAHSEASDDMPHTAGNNYYQDDQYNAYHDVQPGHGPYGDGTYGGAGEQPVIRDVAARRNTRIERVPTFPQTHGGIAQNF